MPSVDPVRRAYLAEVDGQLVSWLRMASLLVGILFLCTGTATLLLADSDLTYLVAARAFGSAIGFAGYWALGHTWAQARLSVFVAVISALLLAALGAVCWRGGGVDSVYINSAPVAYVMTLLVPTMRRVFVPLILAFLAAMVVAGFAADPAVPPLVVLLKTIYQTAIFGMFVFGGYLMDRFRFRAFAARHRLRQFLPAAVADGVIAGTVQASPSFERRKVTILFADLVSFTDLTDSSEPEEISALLNDYLREMSATAVRHGGNVDKFVGDAVMVLFGAPAAAPEAEQTMAAVRTGLEMQQRVARLSVAWRERGIPRDLQVRVGINTGYCTVGVFGSDELKSYTAIGTPVNVAARLEAEATPGTVLCSFSTYSPIRDQLDATPRGPLQLRGVSRTVDAYEIARIADG